MLVGLGAWLWGWLLGLMGGAAEMYFLLGAEGHPEAERPAAAQGFSQSRNGWARWAGELVLFPPAQ